MPTKKPSKSATNVNASFRGFLNIELTEQDKATIKSTAYDGAAWSADLDKWVDNGFKFTFGYDAYNHCFQCIGARSDREHKDYGIMLTGRGSTAIKSFKQWVYIQTRLVGDSDWSELLDTGVARELDD
jgi:hypothetical protein